jgi:hypothetical protein
VQMGRTRLRGIDIGGVLTAIEVPQAYDWNWEAPRDELPLSSPSGADVHVGVRVGRVDVPKSEGVVYATARGTIEVGRTGDDWWIAVCERGRCERVGRFSSDFSVGEIVVCRDFALRQRYPLEHPLDEIVTLHRVLRTGGMLLRGTAVLRDSRALVVLGSEPAEEIAGFAGQWPRVQCSLGARDLVVLRRAPGGVRVLGEVQHRERGHAPLPTDVPLDAIHVVRRTTRVSAERLQVDDALSCLLDAAVAPIHAGADAERLMEVASEISWQTPVLEMELPKVADAVPFRWGERQAGLGFSCASAI